MVGWWVGWRRSGRRMADTTRLAALGRGHHHRLVNGKAHRRRRIMRGPVVESAKSMKALPTSGSSVAIVSALGPYSRRPADRSTSELDRGEGKEWREIYIHTYRRDGAGARNRLSMLMPSIQSARTRLLHAHRRLGQRGPPWLAPDPGWTVGYGVWCVLGDFQLGALQLGGLDFVEKNPQLTGR